MDHDGAIKRCVGDDYWIMMEQSDNVLAVSDDSWTMVGNPVPFGDDAWIIMSKQASDVLAMIPGS